MIDFEIVPWPIHVFDPQVFAPAENKQGWKYKHGEVYFLLSERGNSLEVHIGAVGKNGKRCLVEAGKLWLEQVPQYFEWAEMLLAPIKLRSVYNYCKKMGFEDAGVADYGNGQCRLMFWRF